MPRKEASPPQDVARRAPRKRAAPPHPTKKGAPAGAPRKTRGFLSDLLSLDLPNACSVLLDRTVGGELAGVADVDPALSCPLEVVLVVLVEAVALLSVVVEVAEDLVGIAGLPVGAVDEAVEEVVEHACALVVEGTVNQTVEALLEAGDVLILPLRIVVSLCSSHIL